MHNLQRLRALRGRLTHARQKIDDADYSVTVGELAAALRRELLAAQADVAGLIHDAKADREADAQVAADEGFAERSER